MMLITHDPITLALTILLAALVLANVLTHWFVVCRALYQRGARFPTGLLFWRVFRELRTYRQIRKARGLPWSAYHVVVILTWCSLFLAVVVLIRVLWDYTHPFSGIGG